MDAASEPLAVEVMGEAVEGPVIAGRARGGIAQLREDIRFIHIATPRFRPIGRSLIAAPAPLSN